MILNTFLQGAAKGLNHTWRYLIVILMVITGYALGQAPMTLVLQKKAREAGFTREQLTDARFLLNPERLRVDKNLFLLLMLLSFVVATIMLLWGLKLLHKRSLKDLIAPYRNIDWGRFLFSFGIWAALLIISTLLAVAFAKPGEVSFQFNPTAFVGLFFIALLIIPIQTSFEELFIRGYLMQGFGLVFKKAFIPLILSSVIFGALHLSNPEVASFGWATMLPYYIGFGLLMGAITLLDDGLELALGLHAANNALSALLLTSKSSVLQTPALFKSNIENPGNDMLMWFVMALIYFAIVRWKYGWTNFAKLTQ